ncbi:MAG TPA: O-acetyl-ADP-ribose deacetylase [Dinghuibacter sp.]|jgi:O-acetyl-ADP-ribose deacetylase (regulator of RNase III)|uniref:O-acetyl-ADP-ribose deacetylase n=1 Tax=Dinghuibacter sp. TaxID=2024697 RepID=UPI002C39C14F|nr:O-acetyl-ADP-ribose deacetylase [Dinghuibacter sp.]HTJ12837.1 O-acetyl-ADP-ribose deacetylase [Dinghuibacter sp.]
MHIEAIQGDITTMEVDAIVNAANTSLLGGGGVDGAIHRKGGKAILEACIKIRERQGGCPTGEAVITTGGNLPARWVIHTVGPVWNGGKNDEPELLARCYKNSLNLAMKHDVKSLAIPNISTGIYRFPKELAAEIAVKAVREHGIDRVIFVCYESENLKLYRTLLES